MATAQALDAARAFTDIATKEGMMIGLKASLALHAHQGGDRPAVVSGGVELGYAELIARAESAAAALGAAGIQSGSVVGLTIADELEHLVATLAVMFLGAPQIVLASHDAPVLREHIGRRVGVSHVLVDDASPSTAGTMVVRWPPPASPRREAAITRPAGDAVLYLKTSGTTGDMNIVAFTETQIAAQAERHLDYRNERLLRLASIEHNNSKRHRLYCLFTGGTNVFRSADVSVPAMLARDDVTCLDISRMHAADLARAAAPLGVTTLKLRTGGSAVPFDVRRAILERVTERLYVRYAATECGAIAMAGPGDHDSDETSGPPLQGVELQIVDEDDHCVGAGSSGTIRLRAAGMATGYVDDPQQSAHRFRDGWFYPGDVGFLRSDGQLVVQGRSDDMIVLNGLNICPSEIERVLERHPAVAEAAALPLASRVHGQIPVAAVTLHAGASVSAEELRAYCRVWLGLRTPRRIVVVDSLPRNAQGKMVKTALRSSFAALEKRS